MSAILAQSGAGTSADLSGLIVVFAWLLALVLVAAGNWRVFSKAGHAGILSLVPLVNIYILCKIAGRPGWWVILMFLPLVNLLIGVIVSVDVAKAFGKGLGFGVGLALLAPIFYPILGFGSAEYLGPAR